ncbi:MAG: mechanosensitive ion channel [Comamonadaceae bacterium]|nr:mechanosensitive ion channel [Comamonadaceae bacterium]
MLDQAHAVRAAGAGRGGGDGRPPASTSPRSRCSAARSASASASACSASSATSSAASSWPSRSRSASGDVITVGNELRRGPGPARPPHRGARPRRARHPDPERDPAHRRDHQLVVRRPATCASACRCRSATRTTRNRRWRSCCARRARPTRVLTEPEPAVRLMGFGDNGIDLELRLWIHDPENGVNNVRSEVYLKIWRYFREAGISIPYPQRDVALIQDFAAAPAPPVARNAR